MEKIIFREEGFQEEIKIGLEECFRKYVIYIDRAFTGKIEINVSEGGIRNVLKSEVIGVGKRIIGYLEFSGFKNL